MAPSPPLAAFFLLLLAAPARAFDPATEGVIEADHDTLIDRDTSMREEQKQEADLREQHKRENAAMLKAKIDFTDRAAVKRFLDEFRRTGQPPQKDQSLTPQQKEALKKTAQPTRPQTPKAPGDIGYEHALGKDEPQDPDAPAVEEPHPSQPGEPGPRVSAGKVGAVDDQAPQVKDEHDESGKLRAQAFTKAKSMGEALKGSLTQGPGDLPEGGGVGGGPLQGRGGVDPADPHDKSELIAAAGSGFKSAFSALGLSVRRDGEIAKADGGLASEADLAALKARIKEEPRALMRHPDLYAHIPREKFMRLKDDYASGAKPEAFEHIALQERRDFVRSASCDKVSGGCNRFAKASYRVGDDVPPKELRDIDAYIHEGADSDERVVFDEDEPPAQAAAPAAGKRGIGKAGFRPVYARLNQVINAIQDFIAGKSEAGRSASAGPQLATPIALSFSARREPVAFTEKPARIAKEVSYPQEYGNRTPGDKSGGTPPLSRRVPASGLGLGVGAVLALALWRARR